MSIRQEWGRRIRLQRKLIGLSQLELAKLVRVDQSAVSFWEMGHRAPSLDHQISVARALRCHPSVLFAFIEEPVAS